MHWVDVIRTANALGCLFGLMLLSTSSYRHWFFWNTKTKVYWWAFFGYIFLGLESSIEALITDAAVGPRLFLQSILIAWTLIALLIEGEITMRPDFPWKKDDAE